LDRIFARQKQKRPNTVQPLGGINDPAKSEGPIDAAPIRGARLYFQDLVFFLAFFFFAMTLFLGFADELRQGWFKSRA
jgi:preprotein translocase subunit SecG